MKRWRIVYRFMSGGLNQIEKEAPSANRAKRLLFDQLGSRYLTIISVELVK